MSQENVEIAKRAIDAHNRSDDPAWAALATPDYESFPAVPRIVEGDKGAVYRGREGLERAAADITATWSENRIVAEEVRDLGERVLVLGHIEGRGLGSGAPVRAPWGCVLDFRDGKICSSRGFLDHREALRAAESPPRHRCPRRVMARSETLTAWCSRPRCGSGRWSRRRWCSWGRSSWGVGCSGRVATWNGTATDASRCGFPVPCVVCVASPPST